MFYRVILENGDEIEDDLGFDEGTFIMFEVVPDPNDPEAAMLLGLDEKLNLAIYYFRFSGFDEYDGFNGESVVPVSLGETADFYISDIKGEFIDDKFYAGAICWKGGFREGYTNQNMTHVMGIMADLKGPKIKTDIVSSPANQLIDDYGKKDYKPTQVSKILETDVLDGQIYFKIKEYGGMYGATEPYGAFRYTYLRYGTIFIDIENDDVKHIDATGSMIGQTINEGGSLAYYTVEHDKSNKLYKKTPYVVKRNYYHDGELKKKDIFHLNDFLKGNEIVRIIGYHTDDEGTRYMYAMRPRSKYELLKIKLPDRDY